MKKPVLLLLSGLTLLIAQPYSLSAQDFVAAPTDGPSITFTTSKKKGESISLRLNVAPDTPKNVWIDMNANGSYDVGEEITKYNESNKLTLKEATTLTLYGDLTIFWCEKNKLTNLDVSKCPSLQEIWCHKNNLSTLDITKNKELTELNCFSNSLQTLNVSKNVLLTGLFCYKNELSALDVTKNNKLTRLECYGNKIKILDVTQLPDLTKLWCGDNQLSVLDITHNPKLTDLSCYANQLRAIDLSNNTELKEFDCGNNKLTALNVTNNKLISWFRCDVNQLKDEEMTKLLTSLADRTGKAPGYMYLINPDEGAGEKNICTKKQVAIATQKNWGIFDTNDKPYEGSEDTAIDYVEDSHIRIVLSSTTKQLQIEGVNELTPILLYSSNGQLLYRTQSKAKEILIVDVSYLVNGIYLIKIGNECFRFTI